MSKRRGLVIAMDGPAGVGKSTVGNLVAKSLGFKFINTGEMYRALTWKGLEQGVDLNDHDAVLALAKELSWEFKPIEEGEQCPTPSARFRRLQPIREQRRVVRHAASITRGHNWRNLSDIGK